MPENDGISLLPQEVLISKIYEIRGTKVMLDHDLAELYEVETKALKQAVRRNLDIFPEHFMFELTKDEFNALRSQIVTSKEGRGGTRYLPMVFTEHGILQLANVLRSKRAKFMGIRIIEVFVKMREMMLNHAELFAQLEETRRLVSGHDEQIKMIFEYLQQLEKAKQAEADQANRTRIGYRRDEE
ncbi:MAG: ORF6N domain-containing protein [Flavobacteriales bacterium]|nr:ORF6N domain-containing protein [Flavobacteriales bacterium]